jgi:preprotein translocase subunit YajC
MADRYPLIVNTSAAQIQELASGDNLNLTGSNISAVTNITASGFLTINSANNVTAIVNGGSNAVGNIGSSTTYFNTVFATATTAQYADLAENYLADTEYSPGTVVDFGGNQEVTISAVSHSTQVAGVISTKPAYQMNSGLVGDHVAVVALTGRVPCQVIGNIKKGDRLVTSSIPGVATALDMDKYQPGCIIGKSLADYNSVNVGTIEIAVGRV